MFASNQNVKYILDHLNSLFSTFITLSYFIIFRVLINIIMIINQLRLSHHLNNDGILKQKTAGKYKKIIAKNALTSF